MTGVWLCALAVLTLHPDGRATLDDRAGYWTEAEEWHDGDYVAGGVLGFVWDAPPLMTTLGPVPRYELSRVQWRPAGRGCVMLGEDTWCRR